MPLIQGKSKKAFQHNVEAEMKAHPGKERRAQNLAIAYSIKRKNQRKKMASGGSVEISAADEKRPMPEQEFADKMEDSRVRVKPLKDSGWLDNPSVEEAGHSKSKAPDSAADHNFHDEHEANIDNAVTPEEMEMIREHRRKMALGGAVEHTPSTSVSPFEDEHENARGRHMIEAEHERDALARGGEVSPQDEIDEEHHESVAAAIMAKRRKMADGGMVDLEKNSEEDLNNEDQMSYKAGLKEQYDLGQLDEQPEDSNEHADHIESDDHDEDMISSIRRRMSSKRFRD